jgi:threonine synthase
MGPQARVVGLSCPRCRARFDEPRLFTGCPRCRADGVAVNLSVEYDLSPLAGITPDAFGASGRGLWRFSALLPARGARPVSLGEGSTPLVHLERLGRRLGLPRLFAKNESQNPTWSYKDRLCTAALTHAVQSGARVITISSTGDRGVRRARRFAVRHLHARVGARDDEDAHAGLWRRRRRVPDARLAVGIDA